MDNMSPPARPYWKLPTSPTVWVEADVYEYELPWIKVGQSAVMTLTYLPGETFHGRVQYIYPYMSGATRTARVRLDFPNPKLRLKPDMFAQVEIKASMGKATPVIPSEAVLDTGEKQHVFISLGQGRFEPREVKLGLQDNDNRRQVLAGLKGGEEVVTSAQFLLDSESRFREAIALMLKSGDKEGKKRNRRRRPCPATSTINGHPGLGGKNHCQDAWTPTKILIVPEPLWATAKHFP